MTAAQILDDLESDLRELHCNETLARLRPLRIALRREEVERQHAARRIAAALPPGYHEEIRVLMGGDR